MKRGKRKDGKGQLGRAGMKATVCTDRLSATAKRAGSLGGGHSRAVVPTAFETDEEESSPESSEVEFDDDHKSEVRSLLEILATGPPGNW